MATQMIGSALGARPRSSWCKVRSLDIAGARAESSWVLCNFASVARYFSATLAKLQSTQELSALAPAMSRERTLHQDDLGLAPNAEPIICVAMKPLDGTFAQNAERYGVA